MTDFPLLLDVRGRRVVVVGAGPVGVRRARRLADAGADVLVVSARADPDVEVLGVPVTRRAFQPADLDGAWLAFACTDDPGVNAAVAAEAERRRIFCVRADDAGGGTARTSVALEHDGITVAVNGGDDPRRAVALRDAIAAALDVGELPVRRHRRGPGLLGSVAAGSVALVGGGPGDPELITVRGRRLLAEADVVVVDRLAPRELLAALPADVEVIDCGKSAHRHNLTQDQINEVLVERARAGRRVVRLKGGDPFVFGRGGEEWLACVAAGVPVTVVPGVTSAVAAPASAGIPLTHRGVATDFTVVSGHLEPGRGDDGEAPALDWAALASSAATLVLLMAMERLGAIATELIANGRPAATPAAVVHRATTADQQVVRARLDAIADAAQQAGVGAPAVVVVGNVVDVLLDVT